MKLIIKTTVLSLLFIITKVSTAQEVSVFSMDEAIEFAMENNFEVINSEKDIEAAKARVAEATSIGLPQINGSINYNDNLARPTVILPGEMAGTPGEDLEVQFGTKYDASLGASASQLIFSGEYLVGLKGSKKYLELTTVDFFKDKIAVRRQVAQSYFDVLATEEALKIVDTTLIITRNLAHETRQVYEVGFLEDIDADQIDLLVADLEASQVNLQNTLMITHAYLKFYLGLNENDSLVLTDDFNDLIIKRNQSDVLTKQFSYTQNVNYLSLAKQKELSSLQVDLEKAAYLPTLSASLYYQLQAQRDTWNFFDFDEKWYGSSAFGVSMQIPILSGGSRRAKVKQKRIAFEQVEVAQTQLATTLQIDYKATLNEYVNARTIYMNKEKNKTVSERIYLKTTEKFKEGMASSLDILNTQNQFLSSQRDFINSANAMLKAGLNLELILINAIQNQ